MLRRHLCSRIPVLLGSLALWAAVPNAWAQQAGASVDGCALAAAASGWQTIAVRSGGITRSLPVYRPRTRIVLRASTAPASSMSADFRSCSQ
jgi:hypothetical protein